MMQQRTPRKKRVSLFILIIYIINMSNKGIKINENELDFIGIKTISNAMNLQNCGEPIY